jgi:hypothetical protein
MKEWIRRRMAGLLLSDRDRRLIGVKNLGQPWIRAWFRREWWDPARRDLMGAYPPGHRYYQENPIIRFYPLAMTVLFGGPFVVRFIKWLLAD